MLETILFVVNPIAGGRDKAATVNSIREWAQSSNREICIIETTGKNDHININEKIEQVQPDKVVSVGGDGTLLLCVKLLQHHEIPLGIIPMGSANGMATELQIPTGINAGLQVIETENTLCIDVLCINDQELGIHISDIGINARLVKYFEESERRGFWGYAEGLLQEYIKPEYFKARIKTDNTYLETDALMIAFANAKRYGTGAYLNQKGRLDDGLLEVCVLNKLELSDLAEHLIDRVNENSEHIKVIQCREVEVWLDHTISFQVDGEVKPATDHIKVNIIPKALNLIIPG